MRYLGTITVANGVSVNNLTTAVPFIIPVGFKALRLLASGADCYAFCSPGTDAQVATTTTGASIGTTEYTMPINACAGTTTDNYKNVLAVFNNNAASRTVSVFGDDAS